MEIESDRFNFIRLDKSHVSHEYLDWLNDPEINRFLEVKYSENNMDSLTSYLDSINNSDSEYLFGIFYGTSHIGNIKIGPVDKRYLTADIGLLIGDQNWWNKGVATESIYAITKFGFDELGLKKIEAGCYESNIGSKKAFIKCGYKIEGLIREHVILDGKREGCYKMGMTYEEWKDVRLQ